MGLRDLPDQPGGRDQAGASDQAGVQDQPGRLPASDRPAPGSRADLLQRLNRLSPGHPSSAYGGDLADRQHSGPPDPGFGADHPPDERRRDYWTEAPRFERMWAEHAARWPEAGLGATVDRSRDPAGSWRGDGNQYLSPEQHAQAKDVIASVREAEEPISKDMRTVERGNAHGAQLAGWEFRLKGEDRLKEKIAGELGITPALKPADAIDKVNDAIRYTFCAEPESCRDAYWKVKGMLEADGYKMIYSKNHWRDDPEYKGINTRWATPDDHRFEVQFHTPESFHAKQQITHRSYERVRNPLTGRGERRDLEAFQREVSSWIAAPGDSSSIPDYEEAK